MNKVFISYSHNDKPWVKDYLLTGLEKNGIPCHIDYRDFEIGAASLINMERAVDTCAKTILVYTPNWVASEFTQVEGVMLQTESPMNFNKKMLPLKCASISPIITWKPAGILKTSWKKALMKLSTMVKPCGYRRKI
jgi:hypothetical protein